MIKQFFISLWNKILTLIVLIVGKFSWNSPPWIFHLKHQASTHPRRFWGTALVFFLIGISSLYGYYWYKMLPQPEQVTAHITVPRILPAAKDSKPDSLTLDFGVENGGFSTKSVAPLNLIGKEVPVGIRLSPRVPGQWIWQTDSRLVFTPEQEWPPGQTYQIDFAKDLFTSETKMASFHYSFSTQAFSAAISELKFYQDPINLKQRQVIATINFNYPVDPVSFEKHLTLKLQALNNLNAEQYQFTVNYDEFKRTAYVHSETLKLPDVERYLILTLDQGVQALTGTSATNETLEQSVLIPDVGSYFKISGVNASIVRNQQDHPEQVLSIESTLGVTNAELAKRLHVYLLPKDYPATSLEEAKPNYTWQNPGEVTNAILAVATPVELQAIPADRDYATLHSYKFNASAPRSIYIKLDKGIRGYGDYVLSNDYTAVISVPEYPKEISFLHKGALLALSSEKKLSVVVRGIPAVKFNIARVLPDELNQLITQTRGTFSNPQFIHDSFNQDNISEIFSEIKSFDATDPAKAQYTALDIGKYLANKTNVNGPHGLFLLTAQGWDETTKRNLDVNAQRLILITDLGLVVKDNIDGSHDVFVQSITEGKPVAHVNVSILGKNGLAILTQTTDVNGHVNFPSVKDFINEREPTAYLASLKNDVAFIPYNYYDRQLNYTRYDIGGQYTNTNADQKNLTAYLFSDRGIYRPGDSVHLGMIVKQTYVQPQPSGLPVDVIVTDPRGVTIKDQTYTLDDTGYLTLDFSTQATSPTGQYTINLYTIKDNRANNLLGSTTVQVAEFLPDRMRITARLSTEQKQGWISPDDIHAEVGLWNLFGAPATDRKISARMVLAPHQVQFKEYADYHFVDPLFDPKKPPKTFTDNLTNQKTNDAGLAAFDLNLNRFDKATYQLNFYAEGFEAEGGRSVTTETHALVSPLAYLVGYKTDGDVNYIKQNEQRQAKLIAINPQLKQIDLSNLTLQLSALHPVSTLVKNADGTYQYQSIVQSTVVSTTSFAIHAQGTNYALPTQQIGDFNVSILDQNKVELSHFNYSVVGASQLALAKNAELSLKLSKATYLPDEEIELQITAPYTGTGLITIERDKVYAYQWFNTTTSNSVQKIRVPKDFQGNGYVNVTFARDFNSPEIFISPLSYSVAPFSVNHDNHAIKIDLTVPATARPGEAYVINYKSDKPGKIIVYAVDEGILQVANYQTPDPLAFFFQKYALEVITEQTVDQILPKFISERELSAVGGDASADFLRSNLNPFKRKTDLPVVYWSGIVDTDTQPRELIYNVPDYFNGALRVMAVAVSADAVGASTKSSEIRGDFVINPNVPSFAAPGDEFDITAGITNNMEGSGANTSVVVSLAATPELEIVGSPTQTILIDEGHEQTVRFTLRAKNLLGSASVTLIAKSNHQSSKMNATLSIRPATPYATTLQSGASTDSKKIVELKRQLYPEERKVEAVVANNPLILVFGLQRYLDNYPYGCTEQLVSKVMPLLSMSSLPSYASNMSAMTNNIAKTITMLTERQMSSGAFSYWPNVGENQNNTFATLYAMHFLTEAHALGFDVPKEMFSAGINYLKDFSSQTVTNLDQARLQAYAIYLLTRNEIVTTNYVTNLQVYLNQDKTNKWRQDITSAYLAATYQLLKSNADAARLIKDYKPNTSFQAGDFYNTNVANAQYLFLIAKHFPDLLPDVSAQLLIPMVNALNTTELNTVYSGYASLALGTYSQSYNLTNVNDLAITETFNDGQQTNLTQTGKPYQRANIDNNVRAVVFNNSSTQTYFYQLSQAGFDKNRATQVAHQGMEIFREYRKDGNVVTNIGLGDEIEVHIQIRALNHDYLSNIVIVDLLPGGFEVVNDSVNNNNVEYVDVREDRVIFFTSLTNEAKEISYRIKATNVGHYTVPPIFATSMYNPGLLARGVSGEIVVS